MMISSKRKVAFIKNGNFSHINAMILEVLTDEFQNLEIEVIDIFSGLVDDKDLITIFNSFREYGTEILYHQGTIIGKQAFTSYFFDRVKQSLHQRLVDRDYLFTFQTQSFFDGSIEGIPHFLYTDHTALANLKYPGFIHANLPSNLWLECEKDIYHNATLNFTMSTNIANSIVRDYACDADKVVCVNGGANVSVAEDEIFDDRRYAAKNILFVGIDWERKGGPILAEAFKLVLAKHPDASLNILGCIPEINISNCNVVGKVSLTEVSEYFKKASVFCLPTRLEPFGIVFLEAMAHKLPIVATNIGAIPEFTIDGKNGYIVEPNNSLQLAEKLIDLIESPEKCKAFGAYGHQFLWNTYTWKKTGLRLRQNIEQFIYN